MLTRDEVLDALCRLDADAFEDVIKAAYRLRCSSSVTGTEPPNPCAEPVEFARWMAQRHMSSDGAIERVIYLPSGAPHGEIRLLEVNRLSSTLGDGVIEPLDFTPDDHSDSVRVFVADVTADQWEQIQRHGGSTLPAGWRLEDTQTICRQPGAFPNRSQAPD